MAGAAVLGGLAGRASAWLVAELVDAIAETPRVRTLVLETPDWPGHRAGRHLDVRLTAEDGYQAQRSYSLAAGGSGFVPLMAMLRNRAHAASEALSRLLHSSRSWDDVIYREVLEELAARGDGIEVVHPLTRSQPPGSPAD